MDICKSHPIVIKAPVNLNDDLNKIYLSLNSSGYNLFNINDSFYKDVCTKYTSQNGTDISMLDRKNIIYDNYANISLCQSGCNFLYYDYENKKVECECKSQKNEIKTEKESLTFDNLDFDSFYKTLKYSNFIVMKCYKLVFSIEGQLDNKGSYIMSSILIIFIFLFLWYCIKGNTIIDKYILDVLTRNGLFKYEKIKKNNNINKRENINTRKRLIKKTLSPIKQTNNNKQIQINNNNINIFINRNKLKKNDIGNNNNNKRHNKYPPKRKRVYSCNSSKLINEHSLSKSNFQSQTNYKLLNNKKLLKAKVKLQPIKKHLINKDFKEESKILNKKSNNKRVFYNDEEMNEFDYEKAIMLDKRTFCQYYCSLIKKKHLILFTFILRIDYNLIPIKICLLLFSFSLYFTINGFFFSDDTMNKLYENYGEYDFVYQIPQLLYSLFLSGIINTMLKKLSLTEKEFFAIKHETKIRDIKEKAIEARKKVKIKLALFFIISFLHLLFFWYFICCFCAVYVNTQLILIQDTLISFAFSMIYPFGLYLLPGIFRISALRAKKNKKYLFSIGSIIAMI